MTQHSGEEYLSPEEASSILGVSRRTIERYAKSGQIQRYRTKNRKVLFKKRDVEQFQEEMNQPHLDQGDM